MQEQLVANLLASSTLLQDDNNLFKTCQLLETSSATSCEIFTCIRGKHAKISHLLARLTNKPSTSCVHIACPKLSTSMEQLVNSCNDLVDIIRRVTRLFQQVRFSHDKTILLQSCVVNLVTFLLYHDCIRRVRTTL